jgi:ABC-type Na+ efflux pump permease subunit
VTTATVLRIARWEVTKSAGNVDRRTLALAAVGVLLGALVGPAVVSGGIALDDGIYRVGVAEDSPYSAVVSQSPQFTAGEPTREALDENRIDILVTDDGTVVANPDTPQKSRAALSEFRSAVENYNDRVMRTEPDQDAAFPVEVALEFESRTLAQPVAESTVGSGDDGGGDIGGVNDGGNNASGTTDRSGDGSTTEETDAEASTGESGTGTVESETSAGARSGEAPGDDETGDGDPDDGVQAPGIGGGGGGLFGSGGAGTPGSLSPPFPFASLVLAFLFIVPMNFVIQAYGSTILDERINRRGELLLVAPVTPRDIVAGKTLPYVLTLLAITVGIALAIGGGAVSVAAVAPLALLFLAATFVGAMFARSFKELTFVTVTISVFLTSYAFVPAVFADVTPIAFISPLTLVVWDLGERSVTLAEYAFSTGPVYLSALLLFTLGVGVYREEDMFTQRPVHLKALDALSARIRSRLSVVLVGAASVPFVFVAELLAVALLFALPLDVSLPLLLVTVAVFEEVAKSVGVYAGFVHGRFDRSLGTALSVGALSGLGFFAGEKLTAVVQAVGLTDLTLGRAAFGGSVGGPLLVAALVAPLALHSVTAAISAAGARRGPYRYAAAVAVAVVVHAGYNAVVVAGV